NLLGERLPAHLVPSAVVVLDTLPLTLNGKLDKAALPAQQTASHPEGRAPRTPREEALCALFAEVLGVRAVTIDDGFFDLGGDSILSMRLVSRVRTELGVDLELPLLFRYSTVAALAAHLPETRPAPRPALRPRR
ncbi:MAG: phosphopantetheine-binding protein, partial [Streptomyces sp.]|nr:phosphopantetheine-binding protein [Streptomyces sp.]